MVEALGQTLGALGRLVLQAGGHGSGDGQKLGLDAPSDAAAPALELCLQAGDRPLQARHGIALTCLTPVGELDDLTHDAIVEPGSDSSSEPPAIGAVKELVLRVVGRAEEMQRYVRLVADHPGVVTRRDVEQIARREFVLGPVAHLHRAAPGHDEPDVLDLTE